MATFCSCDRKILLNKTIGNNEFDVLRYIIFNFVRVESAWDEELNNMNIYIIMLNLKYTIPK